MERELFVDVLCPGEGNDDRSWSNTIPHVILDDQAWARLLNLSADSWVQINQARSPRRFVRSSDLGVDVVEFAMYSFGEVGCGQIPLLKTKFHGFANERTCCQASAGYRFCCAVK